MADAVVNGRPPPPKYTCIYVQTSSRSRHSRAFARTPRPFQAHEHAIYGAYNQPHRFSMRAGIVILT